MMHIGNVAAALGGEVAGHNTILCPGPGHAPKDRSLSVKLDPTAPDGFLTYSHAGDDWRLCRDQVRARLGLPPWQPGDEQRRGVPPRHVDKWDLAAVEADANEGPRAWTEDEVIRIAKARRIWEEAGDPRGTLAERYLREHRRLDLRAELVGAVLRFHPRCRWRNESTGKTDFIPAVIVPFRSIDDDAITAVHRIALNSDGTKLDRRMRGVVHRAAIKLDPPGKQLAIGEGLETAMAARQLGHGPAWALGSVGAISRFPIIECVNTLIILGERGDISAQAIKLCGTRWKKAGRRVLIIMPDSPHSDLNDVLLERKAS
jgi:putative DNA primase/helicase